jgi:hypothetical protein
MSDKVQHPWPPGDERVANGTYQYPVRCSNCGAEAEMEIGKGRPVPCMAGEGPVCPVCGCKNWRPRERE